MLNEKLDQQLIESLAENGFEQSTDLQHFCVPKIKSGRDLVCVGSKGSGKSAALVVSVLQKLKTPFDDNPRAIIVTADTERANQLKSEFERLGAYADLRVHTACDDEKINDQKDKIYMGSDVVIGTPKRLNQVYSLYALNLSVVKIFAIDDADLVMKSTNYALIDRLAESLPRGQKVVFATRMSDWIARFSDEFMNGPEIVEFDDELPDDEIEG